MGKEKEPMTSQNRGIATNESLLTDCRKSQVRKEVTLKGGKQTVSILGPTQGGSHMAPL